MENQQHTRNTALNYGLVLGGIFILISVVKYALGKTYEQEWYTQVLSVILLVAFIILGIKKFKEKNGGLLSLGQGLKTGIGIALIGALLIGLYTLIFGKLIEPDFVDRIVELQREKMLENPNSSEEMIETIGENTRKYFYIFTIGWIAIFNIFVGFVVSLIASLVMQKKEEF